MPGVAVNETRKQMKDHNVMICSRKVVNVWCREGEESVDVKIKRLVKS